MEWVSTIFTKVEVWVGYILTLISLVSFIFAMVKALKEKKYAKVKDLAISFIKEAETLKAKDGLTSVSGQTKKEVVLSKIMTTCNNLGLKYNENEWSKVIDEYVDFTLKVNSKSNT